MSDPNTNPKSQVEHPGNRKRSSHWTVDETLTLITAKSMYKDRRAAGHVRSGDKTWNWVGEYCLNHHCHRSPIQCKVRWDNLNHEYRRVRSYESRIVETGTNRRSYWGMEQHERKEIDLPPNMNNAVYQKLTALYSPNNDSLPPQAVEEAATNVEFDGLDAEGETESDELDLNLKKLAQTLMKCEEKQERRHRELMELGERKLKVGMEGLEMNKKAMVGLTSAVDGISNALHALVSDGST